MEVEESVSSRIKKLTNRRRNSRFFQSLAREIYEIKDLREAIWQCFILEIEESSKYLTQRHFSYLGSNTYEDLLTFRWECVVQEMLDHNPLLLETLLAVCLPRKSMNEPCDISRNWNSLRNTHKEEVQGPFSCPKGDLYVISRGKGASKGILQLSY